MIGDELKYPLLTINNVTEVCQLANVLKHEVQRVGDALHHCHMWVPAMAVPYMRNSESGIHYKSSAV